MCSLHGVLQRDAAGISPTVTTTSGRISLGPQLLSWKPQILVPALVPWDGSLLHGALRLWGPFRTMTEEPVKTINSDPSHPALCSTTSMKSSLVSLCNMAPSPTTCWWFETRLLVV